MFVKVKRVFLAIFFHSFSSFELSQLGGSGSSRIYWPCSRYGLELRLVNPAKDKNHLFEELESAVLTTEYFLCGCDKSIKAAALCRLCFPA